MNINLLLAETPSQVTHKIIVAGGRDLHKYVTQKWVNEQLLINISKLGAKAPENVEIVSGGAAGADTMGAIYAEAVGIKVVNFEARWNNLNESPCKIKHSKNGHAYNALAGFNRNGRMRDYATHLIAFWDKRSPGTKDMINKATAAYGSDNVIIVLYNLNQMELLL